MVREWKGTFVRKDILLEVQSEELEVQITLSKKNLIENEEYKEYLYKLLRHCESCLSLRVLTSFDCSSTIYI